MMSLTDQRFPDKSTNLWLLFVGTTVATIALLPVHTYLFAIVTIFLLINLGYRSNYSNLRTATCYAIFTGFLAYSYYFARDIVSNSVDIRDTGLRLLIFVTQWLSGLLFILIGKRIRVNRVERFRVDLDIQTPPNRKLMTASFVWILLLVVIFIVVPLVLNL